MYYVLAFSLDLHNVFEVTELAGVILLVTAVSNLAISVPTAGGGIGAFEVAAAATLSLLGADESTAGAYAILVHAALLVPVTLLGLLYLWTDRTSLGRLTRESTADRDATPYGSAGMPLRAEEKP